MAHFLLSLFAGIMEARRKERVSSRGRRSRGQRIRRLRPILVGAAAISLLLTACATNRDTRTQDQKERDAEIWTRAHSLRVASAQGQLTGCSQLGVVSERYYEDVPPDPVKKTERMAWPEHVLRFKTAQLGGNAALISPVIERWKQDELHQSRVLGQAYLCRQPASTTASR